MNNIIKIKFGEDYLGSSPDSARLINQLRGRMEIAVWRAKNRAARPTEDPSSWDNEELARLDEEYETIGLP